MTIHSITQQLLKEDYVASESMRRNLLNLNAYAEQIKGDVEKLLGESANEKAIAVALSRMSKEPIEEKGVKHKIFQDFKVKSGFGVLTVNKKLTESHIHKWMKSLPDNHGLTIMSIYGVISIIGNSELLIHLKSILPATEVLSLYTDLFLVSAIFTGDFSMDKYIVFTIVREIANAGVNIYANFTGPIGVGFIVDKDDLGKATAVFSTLIEN